MNTRKGGMLMHISSLPSSYGIGKLGESAYMFADFLEDSGIQVWQILPLSPTSYGDSPYQSFSVHAGNPYFIDFDLLEKQGYLNKLDYSEISWGDDPRRVNYERIYQYTYPVLRQAFKRFNLQTPDYVKFLEENKNWIYDYALFMALKDAHDGKPWFKWEPGLKCRKEAEITKAKQTYAQDISFYCVIQFWFYQQWLNLKKYCNCKGISIVGDIPIYVAYDSADVWTMPKLFQLKDNLEPIAVAGCPPDVFSPTGQLWGNPLYDWDYHKQTKYKWWIERLKTATCIYDTVRIDHFRGFESYYTIPYGNLTAEIGKWEKGPGMDLFRTVKQALGDISIIAEDLGFVTDEVRQLLSDSGYPGMKVLQFAFGGDAKSEYLPQNYTTTNCVVYTGTHDNMTLRGWVNSSNIKTLAFAKQHMHCRNNGDIPTAMVRTAWSSIAKLAVAQMQDFLDSGPEGRMNTPSTTGGNWQYRTIKADFTPRLAKQIYRMNELYNRLPEKKRVKRSGRKAGDRNARVEHRKNNKETSFHDEQDRTEK